MKVCKDCGIEHPLEMFPAHKNTKDRLNTYCRPCAAVRMADWRSKNRDAIRAKETRSARLRRYGITPAQYDQMFADQNGACAICRNPEWVLGRGGKIKALAIDHNHRSNRNRGLLCHLCNLAVERMDALPGWAAMADAYVNRYL